MREKHKEEHRRREVRRKERIVIGRGGEKYERRIKEQEEDKSGKVHGKDGDVEESGGKMEDTERNEGGKEALEEGRREGK